MDRNTLSQYGWLVVALIIILILITSLTPFGDSLEQSLYTNTKKLFHKADVQAVYNVDIDYSVYGEASINTPKCAAGSTVTINCTPNTGFIYNGAKILTQSGNVITVDKSTYSFIMPDEPITIHVEYKQL